MSEAAIRLDHPALLIIDMQHGFCDPNGSMARMGFDVAPCAAAIEPCRRLIAAARASQVPVFYTRYVYRADYADGGFLVNELIPALKEAGCVAEGSWDAEIVPALAPQPGDYVIDKNRFSAFYGTRLEPFLRSLGVRTLIVGGVTTNMCVETTVRDASQRDYRVYVVRQATGEVDAARHAGALTTMGFGFAYVVDLDPMLEALRQLAGVAAV
ncbi:MAG: peroxyureidoacrylate/ureidoacrylate amidohydrolase RutB [Dehalococcoidia bacterium]|nr:MAG: peroxyureidoacrylate/ureidoacrylate amidohydrolase RutB [Dehalococcoidia bacterium]